MNDVKIDLIRNIEIFSSLSDKELLQINEKIVLKEFLKNETILREEDTSEYMYIILFGKAKVYQTSVSGKETILAIHGEGDHFGEMSLIDGKTAPATVTAIENSLVALLSRNDFFVLLYEQKKMLEKILQFLCYRIRESWKLVQILNFKDAAHRVKTLLVMLSDEHGRRTRDGIIISVKLTHQDIADMTGLTRETVTRVLDRWRKEKTIKILKNRLIQLDPDFLLKS